MCQDSLTADYLITSFATLLERVYMKIYMTQLLLLGKVEYGGGPIFKVDLEC